MTKAVQNNRVLPSSVPGTRLVLITDPFTLPSSASYDIAPLAHQMHGVVTEAGNENGVHFALVVPELSLDEILPRVLFAAHRYIAIQDDARPEVEIRRVNLRWFGSERNSDNMSLEICGACIIGSGRREIMVSVISPEYMDANGDAAFYDLHTSVLGTFARIEGNPYHFRDTWPVSDYDTALINWTNGRPTGSGVVSVEWINRISRYESCVHKIYNLASLTA